MDRQISLLSPQNKYKESQPLLRSSERLTENLDTGSKATFQYT